MFRTCRNCKLEQAITEYGEYRGRSSILRRKTCNTCRRADEKLRYAADPAKRERMKRSSRESTYRAYGTTVEDVEHMTNLQNGKCLICGVVPTKRLNVDHCRVTGHVRGLLCWSCNISLGYMKHNIQFLTNAIIYLEVFT